MSNSYLLIETISKCVKEHQNEVSFNGRSVRFNLSKDSQTQFVTLCESLNIKYELHLNNQVEIWINNSFNNQQTVLFFTETDFFKRASEYIEGFDHYEMVIISQEGGFLFKNSDESFSEEKSIFFNFLYYHKIFSFLINQDHFISVHSRPDLQFVIFTSEKGPFYIGYNLHDHRIRNLENLALVYDMLIDEFKKIDFVHFFKAATISTIYGYKVEERFFYLVQSLRVVLNISRRDHYIYIRNFDFEKVKAKFKEERNKYFENLEKNIDSISKQVTSFPLTFAASIFAGYQVKDKPAILILVFLAYSLYTMIAWRILGITELNTSNILTDVKNEEKKIKESYDLIYRDFATDFSKVYVKINKIAQLIKALKVVLIGLLIAFLVFGILQGFVIGKEKAGPTEVRIIK